jgi:hypothetical protein
MANKFEAEWPKRINAIKVISYDTELIYQQILEDNRSSDGELDIDISDIMEKIYNYATDDLSCGWGHKENLKNLIFQDENGEEY